MMEKRQQRRRYVYICFSLARYFRHCVAAINVMSMNYIPPSPFSLLVNGN